MHTEEETKHGAEDESFIPGTLTEDVMLDVFDDGDHPLEDDELASTPHEDEEEDSLFDFFNGGDEFEEKDGMY